MLRYQCDINIITLRYLIEKSAIPILCLGGCFIRNKYFDIDVVIKNYCYFAYEAFRVPLKDADMIILTPAM